MSKSRFTFNIEGTSPVTHSEFFAGGEETIAEVLDDLSIRELLEDWAFLDDLRVELRDHETGDTYELVGYDTWRQF